MRKLLFILAFCGLYALWQHHPAPAFEHPERLAVERSGTGVRQYEFERLLAAGTTFDALAKPGFYTIIEGYTDSCSICRELEADLPVLVEARSDVLVRRVRFNEHGGKQFNARTPEALRAEIDAYAAQLKRYRSFDIRQSDQGPSIGTCGTPHVEIYNPDGSLRAGDYCDGSVYKDGLLYLREWIEKERAL